MNTSITNPPLLDALRLSEASREVALFSEFDALSPGSSFVLLSDQPTHSLLARLQGERPGLFEWSPLEEGPERWRVEVTRRAAAPGPLRQVTEALAWDHDRLDALERSAFAARAAEDGPVARERYAVFARGLRRHIGFEEELLFPAFEEGSGIDPAAGPTAVMRMEHRRIEELLARIEAAIAEPGPAADELRRELHHVLGEHNFKEENVLYPGTDRLLSEAETDALVRHIQAFSFSEARRG